MAAQVSSEDEIVGINITPLVDVMLVLLVIVVVTSRMDQMQGVPMDLPQASTSEAVQTVWTVTMDAAHHLDLNGETLGSVVDLQSRMQSAVQHDPQLRVVIQAAKQTPHGDVLHVLDRLRLVGARHIAFAAEPEPASPSPMPPSP